MTSKTPIRSDIEPWRDDILMKSSWPEWKAHNRKIAYDPKEPLFGSPYSSKPSTAYAHAGLKLGVKDEWEYVGDKLNEQDEVTHWFRHLETRELKGIEAPKAFRVQKPLVAKWVDKSASSS